MGRGSITAHEMGEMHLVIHSTVCMGPSDQFSRLPVQEEETGRAFMVGNEIFFPLWRGAIDWRCAVPICIYTVLRPFEDRLRRRPRTQSIVREHEAPTRRRVFTLARTE